MTQELIDLRQKILEGRYNEALISIDELEGMSKQAILRNIESLLIILLVHLIKNQLEQRLTNSWAASIRGAIREIKKLNIKDNKTFYYIKEGEWDEILLEIIEDAISDASIEVFEGRYTPFQLTEMVDRVTVIETAKVFLSLTYRYPKSKLATEVNRVLIELPGGNSWGKGTK
ncbi:MAG: DUF29 family protein [Cyanobacteriota bacterium]|nr:DUF29 family protein [Cyanobacteriota bacterium]